MWNQAGVMIVSLMSPHRSRGVAACTRRSSCRLLAPERPSAQASRAPATTLSPGITWRSFSMSDTTSGWYSRNSDASASCSASVPSNSSHMRPQNRVRLNSPDVTARRPASSCSFTTSATLCFSSAGSPASSGVLPPARMASRASRRGCGRRREPMCSARKGGAILEDGGRD